MKSRFEGELDILNKRISSFPERLKEVIGSESVRSFARRSSIAESAIRQYLKGASEPTLGNLLAMSYVGKVSINWLVCGDNELNCKINDEQIMSNKWLDILDSVSEEERNIALKNIIKNGFKTLLVDIDTKQQPINADNVKQAVIDLLINLNDKDIADALDKAKAANSKKEMTA